MPKIRTYCYRSLRCFKCAGSHLTKQCLRKEKSENVECVLCEGNHPANYKWCAVYKDLQKRPLQSKQVVKTQENVLQNHTKPDISLLLSSNLHTVNSRLLNRNLNNEQYISSNKRLQLTYTNWKWWWKGSWNKWAPCCIFSLHLFPKWPKWLRNLK